jgi:hypothetical protein
MTITQQKLYCGDTWSWLETLQAYLASAYDLTVYLKKDATAAVSLIATAEGTSFRIAKTATETAAMTHGNYLYQAVVTRKSDSAKFTIETGSIEIYPNIATTDPRGYWQKTYELLKTAYEGLAGKAYAEVTINGRTVRYDRENLVKELNNASYKAKMEARKSAGKTSNSILGRFV